jgi:hypothetical protein
MKATVAYEEREDRIKVLGESKEGGTVVLWLTQRLLGKLIPHLAGRLLDAISDDDSRSPEAVNARGAAKLDPVEEDRLVFTLLVDAVDITDSTSLTIMQFREETRTAGLSAVRLALNATQLSSWLQALRACYQKASWSQDCWLLPEGLAPGDASSSKVTVH